VTAKAQTTRHRILGILSAPDHQALLVDTPGVMSRTRNQLDSAMMRTVRTAVTQADVICVVVDAAAAASARDPAEGMEGLSLTGEEVRRCGGCAAHVRTAPDTDARVPHLV